MLASIRNSGRSGYQQTEMALTIDVVYSLLKEALKIEQQENIWIQRAVYGIYTAYFKGLSDYCFQTYETTVSPDGEVISVVVPHDRWPKLACFPFRELMIPMNNEWKAIYSIYEIRSMVDRLFVDLLSWPSAVPVLLNKISNQLVVLNGLGDGDPRIASVSCKIDRLVEAVEFARRSPRCVMEVQADPQMLLV